MDTSRGPQRQASSGIGSGTGAKRPRSKSAKGAYPMRKHGNEKSARRTNHPPSSVEAVARRMDLLSAWSLLHQLPERLTAWPMPTASGVRGMYARVVPSGSAYWSMPGSEARWHTAITAPAHESSSFAQRAPHLWPCLDPASGELHRSRTRRIQSPQPRTRAHVSGLGPSSSSIKTKMCLRWSSAEGCSRGTSCSFAHGENTALSAEMP